LVKLLVATGNMGKVNELARLLDGLAIEWLSLADVGLAADVAETGATCRANAILKATSYARLSGLLTLADDSGLEVDALGGEPGAQAAYFGGVGLSPAQRYERLLEKLRNVPWRERAARFRSVVALANPGSLLGTAEGTCEGIITRAPAGSGGFGYDPVFFLPEFGRTFAQLASEQKNQISHRARAIAAITPLLCQALGQPSGPPANQ
jgi:XTP/dITP diphosphohydrolase